MLTFSVNQKYNEAFRGVYFLRIREKKIPSNLVLVVILVLESKGFYFKKKKKKAGLLIVLLYAPITSPYNPESILF